MPIPRPWLLPALVAACATAPPADDDDGRSQAAETDATRGSDAAATAPGAGGRPSDAVDAGDAGNPSSAGGDNRGGAAAEGGEADGGAGFTPPEVARLTGTATTGACVGSPPGEGADRLVDGDVNTKFLARMNAPWVVFDAGGPYRLSHYAVTSANDFPERDPARWVLEASNDVFDWMPLDVQVGQRFAGRFERHEHAADFPAFHRWYRFRMENAGGDTTQLAELELYGTSAFEVPARTAPSAPVGLRAVPLSRTSLRLEWTDASTDEVVFRIERALDGGDFAPIGYVPTDETWFTVADLEPGGSATYRVVAENAAGSSSPSAVVGAAPLPALTGSPRGSAREYRDGEYSLTVTDGAPGITPPGSIARMVEAFFDTYPRMAADFNPGAPRAVAVQFDPNYDGVAEALGDHIRVSSGYLARSPDDIDVIVHEGFHLVQAYTAPNTPGWATEGLADYARWAYGTRNNGACWTMQRYEPGHQYTAGYGVTARFFLWLTAEHGNDLIPALDATIRQGAYGDDFWLARTGRPLDALWAAYAADADQPPVSYE